MTRIERIVEDANKLALRSEKVVIDKTKVYLAEVERRLKIQIAQLYKLELEGLQPGRVYREGRARAILAQVQTALESLNGERIPLFDTNTLFQSYEEGYKLGLELLKVYETAEFFNPVVPLEAVIQQVANSAARLKRHSAEAIDKINQAVVNGLVRGRGVRVVTREIQNATGYLGFRAESIARTEMASARADARDTFFQEQGIDLVQSMATLDDRVCVYCGKRHGEIYERKDIQTPYHVRCRCVLLPVRKNWLELGLISPELYTEQRKEIKTLLAAEGLEPNSGLAPFERSNGRALPKPVWTPEGGYT